MVENCIFCQIISGQTSADVVYRDEAVTAFRDQKPAAPVHLLIIPNRHVTSLNDITPEDEAMLGRVMLVARRLAEQNNVSQSGYRLLVNSGPDAGQTIFHLHFHLMGGERLPKIHH